MRNFNESPAGLLMPAVAWLAVLTSYSHGQAVTERDRELGRQRSMLEFQQETVRMQAEARAGDLSAHTERVNKKFHDLKGEEERQPKSDTDREFEKLVGTWIGVAYERDGLPPKPIQAPDWNNECS